MSTKPDDKTDMHARDAAGSEYHPLRRLAYTDKNPDTRRGTPTPGSNGWPGGCVDLSLYQVIKAAGLPAASPSEVASSTRQIRAAILANRFPRPYLTRLSDLIWPFIDSRDAIAAGALKQQDGDDELLAAADSAVTPTVRAEEAQLDEEDQATWVEERLYTEGQDFVLASSIEEITDAILNWKGDEIIHELAIALLEKYTNLEEVQLRFSGVGTETWRRSGDHLVYVDKTTSRDGQQIGNCAHWRKPADRLFRN